MQPVEPFSYSCAFVTLQRFDIPFLPCCSCSELRRTNLPDQLGTSPGAGNCQRAPCELTKSIFTWELISNDCDRDAVRGNIEICCGTGLNSACGWRRHSILVDEHVGSAEEATECMGASARAAFHCVLRSQAFSPSRNGRSPHIRIFIRATNVCNTRVQTAPPEEAPLLPPISGDLIPTLFGSHC